MNKPVTKELFNHSKIANRPHKIGLGEKQGGKLQLCNNCKKLGFCASMIYGTWRGAIANAQPAQSIVRFNIKDYLDLVPVQIEGSRFGNYLSCTCKLLAMLFTNKITKQPFCILERC